MIEAVAAIALIGILLSSLLIAKGRYVRQAAIARRRLDAVQLADTMLTDWSRGGGIPVTSKGFVQSPQMNWRANWRTSVVPNAQAAGLDAKIVRLEVADPAGVVLSSVDILLPSGNEMKK